MAITAKELETLLAENSNFPAAYQELNIDYLGNPGARVDKLRETLRKKVSLMEKNASRGPDVAKEHFATLSFAPAAGNDLMATIFGTLGIGAAAGAEILSHPDPTSYHCDMDVLLRALATLEDEDTRLKSDIRGYAGTVTVRELVNGGFMDAIAISISHAEGISTVSVGKLKTKTVIGKFSDVVGQVAGMSSRRQSLFSSASSFLEGASGMLGQLNGKFFDQIQGLALKFQIWKLLDEAAKPHETAYRERLSREQRAVLEKKESEARIQTLSQCPCCGTSYTKVAVSTGSCSACGFTVSPESMQILTGK